MRVRRKMHSLFYVLLVESLLHAPGPSLLGAARQSVHSSSLLHEVRQSISDSRDKLGSDEIWASLLGVARQSIHSPSLLHEGRQSVSGSRDKLGNDKIWASLLHVPGPSLLGAARQSKTDSRDKLGNDVSYI